MLRGIRCPHGAVATAILTSFFAGCGTSAQTLRAVPEPAEQPSVNVKAIPEPSYSNAVAEPEPSPFRTSQKRIPEMTVPEMPELPEAPPDALAWESKYISVPIESVPPAKAMPRGIPEAKAYEPESVAIRPVPVRNIPRKRLNPEAAHENVRSIPVPQPTHARANARPVAPRAVSKTIPETPEVTDIPRPRPPKVTAKTIPRISKAPEAPAVPEAMPRERAVPLPRKPSGPRVHNWEVDESAGRTDRHQEEWENVEVQHKDVMYRRNVEPRRKHISRRDPVTEQGQQRSAATSLAAWGAAAVMFVTAIYF